MKVSFYVVCTLLVACSRYSNVEKVNEENLRKYPLVHVKDWGLSAMSFGSTYWEDNKDSIVGQIGNEEFEKVKSNCGFKKVPTRMSVYDGKHRPSVKKFNERMTGLKVYKIAAFTLTTKLKDGVLYERMNILRCPYVENKNWDTASKWDTVYFVVHEKAVETVK